MTKEVRINRAGFNAEHSAAMTESQFVKKYLNKVWPGKSVVHQEADLKKAYQLCLRAVGKPKAEAKPEPVKKNQSETK